MLTIVDENLMAIHPPKLKLEMEPYLTCLFYFKMILWCSKQKVHFTHP